MVSNTSPITPKNLSPTTTSVKASTTVIAPTQKPAIAQTQKQPAETLPTKKATLTKQAFDPRFGANYAPLEIRFLTGDCADQLLDLGFNIQEFSMSQSQNWEKGQGQTIQVGHNFTNVSPWSFNLNWEYWGLWDDVHQLAKKALE